MNRQVGIPEIVLALRAAFGSGLSVALAQVCKLEYPIYALIAAVIVTDFSSVKTRELGLQRIGGHGCGCNVRRRPTVHTATQRVGNWRWYSGRYVDL